MRPPPDPDDPAEVDEESEAVSEDEAYQEYWIITDVVDGQW